MCSTWLAEKKTRVGAQSVYFNWLSILQHHIWFWTEHRQNRAQSINHSSVWLQSISPHPYRRQWFQMRVVASSQLGLKMRCEALRKKGRLLTVKPWRSLHLRKQEKVLLFVLYVASTCSHVHAGCMCTLCESQKQTYMSSLITLSFTMWNRVFH